MNQMQACLNDGIDSLRTELKTFETTLNNWLHLLQRCRQKYPTLKLFTNRQIMIMLILLSSPPSNTELNAIFLNRLYDNYVLNNQQNGVDEEQQQKLLTTDCMKYYLRMIET
ncbi:unnamed protein product, partial [Didymodactylos carnosus]